MKNLIRVLGLSLLLATGAAAQSNYAGIYLCDLTGLDPSTDYSGSLAVIVLTNHQARLVGSASGPTNVGLFARFQVQNDGTWSFQTNGFSASGQVFTDGTLQAEFHSSGGGVSTIDDGSLVADLGPFQNQAGYYVGTWSGGGKTGPMLSIVSALGDLSYCLLDAGYKPFDGSTGGNQVSEFDNTFDALSLNDTEFIGSLTNGTLTIGGTFANLDTPSFHGRFQMTRALFVPPNLPPTITVQPQGKTVNYGANATFSVTATGARPLYYQWFSKPSENAAYAIIAQATNRTLVVTNVQLGISGTIYQVIVTNFVGEADSDEAALNAIPETNAPTLTILSPSQVSNSVFTVSNAAFTVRGVATDNNLLDSVWYQFNGGAWTQAIGTSSWSASVTLNPGTNVVAAYSMDTSGNVSPTKRASLFYYMPALLQIQATGQGTISPNYSNYVRAIGRQYTVTASPINGHKFVNWIVSTNWIGGVIKTNPALTFMMEPNLTLQVNFVDTNKPTVAILSPSAGQPVINPPSQVTLTGKAHDNVLVTNVQYQLNGGAWLTATPTSTWTNWSAILRPPGGTNVVKACATDAAGNRSLTNVVSFFYVVTNTLTLKTNGSGIIARGFRSNVLDVGRAYSVTNVAGAGYIFSNWVASWTGGGFVSNNATLTFLMRSNMALTANFVPNRFLQAQGSYNGLFGETNRLHERSGFFSLTLGDHGGYSASLKRGTNGYPFSGKFDVAGHASQTVVVGGSAWTVAMTNDLAGAEQLSGTVGNGLWTVPLHANRAFFNATNNPATNYAGRYTLVFPGSDDASASPGGDGFGTVTVDKGGHVNLSGSLADGNAVSQGVALSRTGKWPLYAPLYGGHGSVWSWLAFDTNRPSGSVTGSVSWIKPALPSAGFYPAGFTNNTIEAGGSRYTAPTTLGTRVIALTDGIVFFAGGNLSGPFTNTVTLTPNNLVSNHGPSSLSLSLTLSNGTFSGKVNVPGTTRTNTFKGALLQDLNSGYGYFLGTNQSGRVFFGAP